MLVWLLRNCFEAPPAGGPVPHSPPSPPPAGTVGSANFPPPVPGSPSPPASLPAAAVALAPGGGQWTLSQSPGRNARQLGGGSPSPSPYLSLQAVKGAGLRLWQLIKEEGTGLGPRRGPPRPTSCLVTLHPDHRCLLCTYYRRCRLCTRPHTLT